MDISVMETFKDDQFSFEPTAVNGGTCTPAFIVGFDD